MSKKILIVSDIHIGESRDSTTNPGVVRQANTQAKDSLQTLMGRIPTISPDLVIHMGDALRDTYIPEIDQKNMVDAYTLLESSSVPVIHLLGNHELRAFELPVLEKFLLPVMKQKKFMGKIDLGTLQVIWIDLELNENGLAIIPNHTAEWLKKNMDGTKPTILFSHYSLVPINQAGSFYFENGPKAMFYQNSEQIVSQLEDRNTVLCVSAHVHMFTHKIVEGVHFISNPAFSENIAASGFPDNNPGVYSILDVHDSSFVFSSYSGDYCYAKVEGRVL